MLNVSHHRAAAYTLLTELGWHYQSRTRSADNCRLPDAGVKSVAQSNKTMQAIFLVAISWEFTTQQMKTVASIPIKFGELQGFFDLQLALAHWSSCSVHQAIQTEEVVFIKSARHDIQGSLCCCIKTHELTHVVQSQGEFSMVVTIGEQL